MPDLRKAVRRINSQAPTRICDNGGWSDTWFAQHGTVLNIAVSPLVEVELNVFPDDNDAAPIVIDARNYGDRYSLAQPNGKYGKHPLIEAAFDCLPVPPGQRVELSIYSEAPAACSIGTSAAVAVAVLGALDGLTPGRLNPYQIAAAAHRVETELLGQQSGIQDQIAAAFGGISFIEMTNYPQAEVHRVELPKAVEDELEARLALIYVGVSHSSSEVHEMVIRDLEDAGAEAPQLRRLRAAAARARDALCAGDFAAFGRSMMDNTEAQRDLHPQLIGIAHQQIIDIAAEHGAWGWKVNGAGGEGGSITLLSGPDRTARRAMLQTIHSVNSRYRNLPIRLDHNGLKVWDGDVQ